MISNDVCKAIESTTNKKVLKDICRFEGGIPSMPCLPQLYFSSFLFLFFFHSTFAFIIDSLGL